MSSDTGHTDRAAAGLNAADGPAHVVVVAHGSRAVGASEEFFARVQDWSAAIDRPLRPAFLELAEPRIASVLDEMAAELPTDRRHRVSVVPYLLIAGRHVQDDLVGIVARARERFPHLDVVITEHLGATPEVNAAIAVVLGRDGVHADQAPTGDGG